MYNALICLYNNKYVYKRIKGGNLMIEISNSEEYLSYFKKSKLPFDKSKIHIVFDSRPHLNKPLCAFWGSPSNAIFGWKEWCECEDFCLDEYDWDNPIRWRLKPNSKILRIDINDVKDEYNSILNKYLSINDIYKGMPFNRFMLELDFNKILDDDIVAIELMDGSIGHRFINPIETMFNTWDCESIVVLDETKIEFIEGENNELE